jgi:mRNA-degrading endonuclease RelE of RelBE toxin-antitoxin system
MAYRVEVSKNAEAELEELYLWVVERRSKVPSGSTASSAQSSPSINIPSDVQLRRRASTRTIPFECSATDAGHVYRIFFTVDHTAKVVRVVHVRRGARPTVDELRDE